MSLYMETVAVVNSFGSARKVASEVGVPHATISKILAEPYPKNPSPKRYTTLINIRRLYRMKFGDPWPSPINKLLDEFLDLGTKFATHAKGVSTRSDYQKHLQEVFAKSISPHLEAPINAPILQAGYLYAHATYLYDFVLYANGEFPIAKLELVLLLISEYQRVQAMLKEDAETAEAFSGVIDKCTLNILAVEMMTREEYWACSPEGKKRVYELGAIFAAKRLAEKEPLNLDVMNDGLQVASTGESIEDCQHFWEKLTQELPLGLKNPWRDPKFAPRMLKGIEGERMSFFYREVYCKGLVPKYV